MNKSTVRRNDSVSTDFMIDCDRLLRAPLDTWANDIRCNLESISRQEWNKNHTRSASAYMNLAALVVANSGDLVAAEGLCYTQLDWLARLASQSGDASVLGNAVQPWINLGRLRVLAGNTENAFFHFRLVENLRAEEAAQLGPCHIRPGMWQLLAAEEPDLPDVLWNVFVLEQLKAYLRSGNPERTLSAAASLRKVAPSRTDRFILEAEIIAFLRSGQAEDALQKATQARPETTSDEIAFLLHQIAALTALGRFGNARRIAIGLSALMAQPDAGSGEPANFLRQLKQLGFLLERLEEPRYALAVYLQGTSRCREHLDEPLHLNFLEGALRLAPEHPSAHDWLSVRDSVLACSLYAEVRRRSTAPALTHPSIRDLIVSVQAAAEGLKVPAPVE
ncbi:hypothetical protein [Streptomyces cinerochromogenes]|uniref:hypothetical protein n=1 Tax=Streptomyces cinerochromogenes TaxID=66422 RepID=UPI0033AFF7FB